MAKKKEVSVVRTEFKLTDEAIDEFKAIHNEWEFEVCEKNPLDALLRDNFRGSHFSENSLNALFSFWFKLMLATMATSQINFPCSLLQPNIYFCIQYSRSTLQKI